MNIMQLVIIFTFMIIAGNSTCRADETLPPPAFPEEIFKDVSNTVKDRIALKFALGNFIAYFEKTSLDAVRKSVKSGVIQHQGDAGESIYWLCYTSSDNSLPQRLWIISSGEMGGPNQDITEVAAEFVPLNTKLTIACPALPKNLQPVFIDHGIWLGMDRKDLIAKLGQPSKIKDDWLIYSYEGKIERDYDETGWLVVRLHNDRVEFIRAGKVTTN